MRPSPALPSRHWRGAPRTLYFVLTCLSLRLSSVRVPCGTQSDFRASPTVGYSAGTAIGFTFARSTRTRCGSDVQARAGSPTREARQRKSSEQRDGAAADGIPDRDIERIVEGAGEHEDEGAPC